MGMAMDAPTRYVSVDGAQVAYKAIGDADLDIVHVSPFSNVETRQHVRRLTDVIERLTGFARVILFDRRGSGVSDPVRLDHLAGWERWADDLRAVLDAVGSRRPALLAEFQAGQWAQLFAASNPDRVRSLVLWHSFARSTTAEGFDHAQPPEVFESIIRSLGTTWGTAEAVQFLNPTLSASDVAAHAWYERTSCTPRRFSEFCTYELAVDTREMLGSITVPTLVLHRQEHSFIPVGGSQYLAEQIAGSRLVTFAGADSDLWAGNSAEVIDVIEEFLTGASPEARESRVLATVLFTDIVASTARAAAVGDRRWRSILDDHDRAASREVSRFRGRLVKSTGDGIVAMFDSPARAVQAADSLRDVLGELGLEIRAGIHTGEVEVRGDDIAGITVHIASRVEALAAPGEILVSRTVNDLVGGSGLQFQDRGTHALKGVPEPWRVFAVTPRLSRPPGRA